MTSDAGPLAVPGAIAAPRLIRHVVSPLLVILLLLISGCLCQRNREDDIRRQEVVEGGNVTLTCYADPGQLRAYRWVYIRAGTQRPQVLSSGQRLVVGEPRISLKTRAEDGKVALELTLSDVRPYESGLFMCWRQGLKPDPQVLLTVLEPGTALEQQVIRQAIGPSEVKLRGSATFTCIVTPSWPVKVTWFKNGEEISVTDRVYTQNVEKTNDPVGDMQIQEEKLVATLIVSSIRKDAVFSCRIESNPPDQRDMPVKVLVPKVESLTAEPDKDLVEYGQPLAIKCVVSGTDSEILWLKDGSQLSFGPHTPGREIYTSEEGPNQFGSIAFIESLTFRDNGHYVCYIPGASKNILINIEGRAPRLLGVTGGDFFEDDTLALRCTTQYSKNTLKSDFAWQFEDSDIDLRQHRVLEYQTEYNVTVHELSIPRAGLQHAGTYKCITPYGTASISVNMFVPPSLGEPLPSQIRVREGDTLRVTCKAVGIPPPTITWERNIGEGWESISNVNGIEVTRDGELKVPVTSLGDSGNYRCAAQSEAGSFLAGIAVTVDRAGPEVYDIVAPESVVVGDNFTVQCTVINWDGEVDFTFHESSLSSLSNSRYEVLSYPTAEGTTQVYLTIKGAKLEDAGRYGCNAGSYASSSTLIEVHDRPAELLDIFASRAVVGQDFFITCIILNGPEKITFYHNGSPVLEDENSRYSMQSGFPVIEEVTHILKITSARPEDEGTYECAVDSYARRSVEVVLEEIKDEVVSVQATPAIVGRDFNVTCTVSNWNEEVTFIHNNVVVDSEKDWRYVVSVSPSEVSDLFVTHTLMISQTTEDDAGNYECYTTPVTYRSTIVSVWKLPDVKLELQSRDRPNWKDSPIPIDCVVEGVDPDTVTVLFSHFNDPQVSIQNRTKMATSDHLVNIAISENDQGSMPSTTFTLGFYSLSTDLTGVWSCDVVLPSGHLLGTGKLFLEIEEPPEFVEELPKEVYVDSDEDLMLNCSTKGSPDIIVAWYSSSIPEPIERRRQSATLFIPEFTAMDAGDYYCSASLLDREIRTKTTLVLRTPQPRVESVVATPAVQGEDITVTCTVSHWKGQVLFIHNGGSVDLLQDPRYVTRHQSHGRREPNSITYTLTIRDATYSDSGVVECFISFEVFGSTNVTVTRADDPFPTSDGPKPTLPPGRVLELQGPDLVQVGSTLTLTCLISPVIPQEVVLIHDVFSLYIGGVKTIEDSRMELTADVGLDGTRILYLTIREITADDGGEYRCATSTNPPAEAVKAVEVIPFIAVTDPEEGDMAVTDVSTFDCSIYTTCTECVATPFSCRWCMDSHRCIYEVEEDCRNNVVVYNQEDAHEKSRAGENYCPMIIKNPPEILIHNGEDRSTFLDSKNLEDERTFDSAKFKCQFNIEGRVTSVNARLWYSHIYCDEANFYYSSSLPKIKVPVEVLWDESKYIENPYEIHVTIYSCALMADTCATCQDLSEEHKCGWCKATNRCEFEGKCSADGWLQPNDDCTDIASDIDFMLFEPAEAQLQVQPSDTAVLPCTASVYFDLRAGYFDKTYTIKWTREVDGNVEYIAENEFLEVNGDERHRYTLDTDVGLEAGNFTKYDLIISPIQVDDLGVYRCSVTNRHNVTISRTVSVTFRDTPQYDRCQLPDHWTGQWYATHDDYTINGNYFGNTFCMSSLGNKYLLRNGDYDCNMCFIIHERHHNLLEYTESICSKEDDLNQLCFLVDDYSSTLLKRKDATIQCPFSGSRPFTYQAHYEEECSTPPSTIISEKSDTELVFVYNQCSIQGNENDIPYPDEVECVATWADNNFNYLMGRLSTLPDSEERYRCYTYMEVENEEFRYFMSHTGTGTCGELGVNSEKSYKVFDESIAPGQPTIEGFGSTIQVMEGYSIQLKCISYGGVPPATLTWNRDNEKLPSRIQQYENRSEAVLDIQVEASDDGAEYRCDAANIATNFPLTVSTILTFNLGLCELPSSWVGRWYQTDNDRYVDITQQDFSNNPCKASLGHSFLLRNERKNCNRCVIITEKHPNILQYKKSKCKPTNDLSKLCSTIPEELHMLVRQDVVVRCPFVGSRSFSYQEFHGQCSDKPSKLYSDKNDTELVFLYNPCPDQTNPNIFPYPERVTCVADWNEGTTGYFMVNLGTLGRARERQYRCFTYISDENGRQLYSMSRQGSATCGALGENADKTYKVYDLSEAPSNPVIEGFNFDVPPEVGESIFLTCITYGGFPQPKLEWFRNVEQLHSDTHRQDGIHKAELTIEVTESTEETKYQCQVSNYATSMPLNASVVILKPQAALPSLIQGPKESHLEAFPSERVILNCTASVSVNLGTLFGLIYRMEWTYHSGDSQKTISELDYLEYEDSRFHLDIENRPEDNITLYNLIIDPVRVTDSGIYGCTVRDNVQVNSHWTFLTVEGTPEYDNCSFPDHWNGEWLGEIDYEINNNSISGNLCQQSFGNKYFLRNEYFDCNECYIIDEKHPNLLQIRKSTCSYEEDLSVLCSEIENDWQWIMKKHATTQCPFPGSRTFTFQLRYGGCSERPSKLYSENNDTELTFVYNPCPDQSNPNIVPYASKLKCLATWNEGETHYLMVNREIYGGANFRCYTYENVEDETYIYKMSHTGSDSCGPLDRNYDTTYKIFDESVAPSQPLIQGYDASERKEAGETVRLTCVSHGAFPPAVIKWFRDGEEIESELHQDDSKSEAHLEMVLEEGTEATEYHCEASNIFTSVPLNSSIIISSFTGYLKIMKSQVMAVEGQNVFLPCALIEDMDLKMEWFDADLDIKLTFGNETVGNNETLDGDSSYHSNYIPYIKNDLFGLIIKSGFLDTKYGCTVGDKEVGNTTLVILPNFRIDEETYEVSDYFEETETKIEANENAAATLNCTLKTGIIPAVVSWRRSPDAQLLTQSDINLVEDDGYMLEVDSQSYILTIPNAKASQSGLYACQMILNDMEVYTNSFTLSIQDAIKGNLSGNTELSCYSPTGEEIYFIHNEEVISPNINESTKYKWEQEEVPDKGGNLTTLIITDTTHDDEGVYTCVNSENPEEILRKVLIGFPSEVMLNISNVRVIEVMGTEVSLAWDPPTEDPFANIEEYEVAYFERGHEDDAVSVLTQNETTLLPFLDEETEYGFQVRVQTNMGWGAFSEAIFQKTGKHFEDDPISSTTSTTPIIIDEDISTNLSSTEAYDDVEDVEKGIEDGFIIGDDDIIYYDDYEDYVEVEEEEEEEEEIVQLPIYEKVVLPCIGLSKLEDVTWKRGDDLLFLGDQDFGGVPGLSISSTGELVLAEGHIENIRDDDAYTCYSFDFATFQDVTVITYNISLNGEETIVRMANGTLVNVIGGAETSEDVPKEGEEDEADEDVIKEDEEDEADGDVLKEDEEVDSQDLKFDLEDEVAVLANSKRIGQKIVEVLRIGGLKVRLLEASKCNATDIRGWANAKQAVQACEAQARLSGDLTDDESIFVSVDFFVELGPSSWFAVTELYLHNVKKDISVNVYAPMVPVPASNIIQPTEPDEPVLITVTETWWNTVQGVDKLVGSGLRASILSLQESYLNLINGQPS